VSADRRTYAEKLKDGRWQEKRLRVLERDGFRCRQCPSKDNLQAHHLFYDGREPWEYEDDDLVTLCERHHGIADDQRRQLMRAVGRAGLEHIPELIGYALGLWALRHPDDRIPIGGAKMAIGYATAWGTDPAAVNRALHDDGTLAGADIAAVVFPTEEGATA
jgi:hypothetical protein